MDEILTMGRNLVRPTTSSKNKVTTTSYLEFVTELGSPQVITYSIEDT